MSGSSEDALDALKVQFKALKDQFKALEDKLKELDLERASKNSGEGQLKEIDFERAAKNSGEDQLKDIDLERASKNSGEMETKTGSPEQPIEEMDRTGALKKHLVACYISNNPTRYYFHFYPTEEILQSRPRYPYWSRHKNTQYIPECIIRWGPEPRKWSEGPFQPIGSLKNVPFLYMSFMHSSKLDNHAVYAVGGFDGSDDHLPKEFVRIPVAVAFSEEIKVESSYAHEVEAEILPPMRVGKAKPLIVEIGGSIYVLSMTPWSLTKKKTRYPIDPPTTFEAYNFKNSQWKLLLHPPFAKLYRDSPRPIIAHLKSFSYLVVDDQKLYVSDGIGSWVYDTNSEQECWDECDLFSECFPNMKLPIVSELKNLEFRNGFPFSDQAILWKDGIYLCIIPERNPPIAAFSISKGQEKATGVELDFGECDLFKWGGQLMHLVDMGDDHVAVHHYDMEDRGFNKTIVMLKLSKAENGSVRCVLQGECCYMGQRGGHSYEAQYCFAI